MNYLVLCLARSKFIINFTLVLLCFEASYSFHSPKLIYRKRAVEKELRLSAQLDDLKFSWNSFDAVYLITTTVSDPMRLDRTKAELESVNLWQKVRVRTFEPDDQDRVRGCYTSHMKILDEAQKTFRSKDNYKVLVLEDNLEKTRRINPKVVKSVQDFMSDEPAWELFHLAYMMYVPGMSLSKISNNKAGSTLNILVYSS